VILRGFKGRMAGSRQWHCISIRGSFQQAVPWLFTTVIHRARAGGHGVETLWHGNKGAGGLRCREICLTLLPFMLLTSMLVSLPVPSWAMEWRGRLMSDLYVFDGENGTHRRPYLGLQSNLVAWRGAQMRSLSFQTYARWTTDFSDKLSRDPQLYVYDAYLRLTGIPKRSEFSAGRQFVYTGIGSALLDGLRLAYRPARPLDLDIFAGSSVSGRDPETVRSLAGFGVFGGRVGVMAPSSVRIGLNWMLRRSAGRIASHRLGVDGEKSFRQTSLFGRLSYDLIRRRFADLLTRASHRLGPWYLSGEFAWREPSVTGNTLFSLLDASRYRDVRLQVERRVTGSLTVLSGLHLSLFEGANVWRTSLGMRANNWTIAWQHQDGDDGDNDGLRGSLTKSVGRYWDCYVTANFSRYRVQPEQKDRSDAYASTAGVQWRGPSGLGIRAEGQYLRNAIQRADFRLLLRLTKDFVLLPRAQEKAP
jgi:hypothetical protein